MATADDDRFDLDDLLWLIGEMPDSLSTPAMLLADCERREIKMAMATLGRLLARAVKLGKVDVWDFEGEPWATLTPLAADELGLKLTADSDRWVPAALETSERLKDRPGFTKVELSPATYIDPSLPEPIDVLVEAEKSVVGPGGNRLKDGSFVYVDLILGMRIAWPVPFEPKRPCPGCGGRQLPRNAYCAVCDNLGVDGLLPPVEPDLRPGGRHAAKASKLAGCTAPALTAPKPPRSRKGARGAA